VSVVLLAEDNPVTLEMVGIRLEHAGHRVIRASNGREALAVLGRERPDLVLLDMMMPEIDGSEFLERVKGDAVLGSIPVIVVSARAHEDDILAALAAGADDYVTKPISLRELLARIDRILAQGREPLRIAVQGEEGPVRLGEVIASTPSNVSVRLHCDVAPRFAIADKARLTLTSRSLPETIAMSAEVVSRTEAEPYRSFGFRIEQRSAEQQESLRAFLGLVGRRGDFRAPIDPERPVPAQALVQVHGESVEFIGTLQDVSARGACVVLKGHAERSLCHVDRMELRFSLPGGDEPLTLTCEIRHRMATPDGVAYGLRYDPEASPAFLEQQEQISEFVLAHMGEGDQPNAPVRSAEDPPADR